MSLLNKSSFSYVTRRAKAPFCEPIQNCTEFTSISLFFFLFFCVHACLLSSWCSMSYSIRWSEVEEEILWAELSRCSTVWPLFTVSDISAPPPPHPDPHHPPYKSTHQAVPLSHSQHPSQGERGLLQSLCVWVWVCVCIGTCVADLCAHTTILYCISTMYFLYVKQIRYIRLSQLLVVQHRF